MMTNLMHINSPALATLDTNYEYQKVFINDKIGSSNKSIFKAARHKTLKLQFKNIEDIWSVLELEFQLYSISKYKAMIIEDDFIASLNWHYTSTHTGVMLSISSSSIKECLTYIEDITHNLQEFVINDESVKYNILQYVNGTLNETDYHETLDIEFNPLATPFIKDVDDYIENFLNSKAPVLILQGEAGTGKTTFVKYILKAMQTKNLHNKDDLRVTYSFDENIFFSNDFYKQLIYDDYDVVVLEDINQMIHKNLDEDGLNPINKFLSITDGLISKYKKIIITTNIESKNQLKSALLRPGRCYDVISFRKLEGKEIDNLCDSCEQDLDLQVESINLSEFYAKRDGSQNSKLMTLRVGF